MVTTSTVIWVFLASPSDVQHEREIVANAISEWNQRSGRQDHVMFDLIRWETSVSAGFGSDGQNVINDQIPDYDLFIALFWKRIGTPTARAISGTVEEYENALRRKKSGQTVEIAIYLKAAAYDPRQEDIEQITDLYKFEEKVESEGALTAKFENDAALKYQVSLLLDRVARQIGNNENSDGVQNPIVHSLEARVSTGTTSDLIVSDRGLFDILESLQDAAAEAVSNNSEIISQLKSCNKDVDDAGNELASISQLGNKDPSVAKAIVNRIAASFDRFSTVAESVTPKFRLSINQMAIDLREFIDVSYDFAKQHENPKELLSALKGTLLNLLSVSEVFRTKAEEMIGVTRSLPRATTKFNRSKIRFVENSELYVDSIIKFCDIIRPSVSEIDKLVQSLEY